MKASATEAEIQTVVGMVEKLDYSAHIIRGVERTVVACVGEERGEQHQLGHLEAVAGVDRVMPVLRSFKLAAREVRPEGSRVNVAAKASRDPPKATAWPNRTRSAVPVLASRFTSSWYAGGLAAEKLVPIPTLPPP